MAEREAAQLSVSLRAERNIAWLTVALGGAAAAVTALFRSPREGVGVAAGTVLAWVNFRWLQQAVDALARASAAQAGAPKPRISVWVYVRFFLRYVLIGLAIYVMMTHFKVPVVSILGGLLSLGAAAMAQSVYEIFVRPK
jgi:hypothetical protein